jgi:hypothetical protein
VNREEELLLASTDRQKLIAASVLSAVDGFCAQRLQRRERLPLPASAAIVD